jgi:hypothetical protein
MSNPCENSCENNDCNCEIIQKNDEKQLKIAEFKEKTRKTRLFLDKNLKKPQIPGKSLQKLKKYQITITDTSLSDGYFMEYTKDINIFEFATILSNIFGIDVNVDYDEDNDPSLHDDVIVFESFEDIIDFIKNRKNEEE